MSKVIVLLAVVILAGCATDGARPNAEPSSDPSPSVMAPPEPEAVTASKDLAYFAERMAEVVSVVIADFLSPDYRTQE